MTALSRNGLARGKNERFERTKKESITARAKANHQTRTFFPDPCVIQIGGVTNDPTSLDSEKDFIGFLNYIAAHTSLARPRREET